MKKTMAVYDSDPFYAERLSDYVNRKETGMFQAQAFTSKEKLEAYMKEHGVDVLLAGEDTDLGTLEGRYEGQPIFLSEERKGPGGKKREIYKYQSGDDIIREVMACYCEMPGTPEGYGSGMHRMRRVIGVYSPVGRCGKTFLAFSIGQILAKEERVLFSSFDAFSGLSGLMGERWKRDLSDLVYYYKQGRLNAIRLNTVLHFIGDMAWLPPMRFPEDYSQISAEELVGMFEEIAGEGNFETLVLDIGAFGKQVLPFLNLCQIVYMPVKDDEVARAKIREFEEYIEEQGSQSMQDKIRKRHVPAVMGNRRMEHFPQELAWGELGDFVRNMLKGQSSLWET